MTKIGIDFGTTHTSVGVNTDGNLKFITLDETSHLLRSMLYITRDHDVYYGKRAALTYLEENTGRQILLEEKVVGTVENWVAQMARGPLDPSGPLHLIYDVIVDVDVSSPGRLIQSIKMGLGQPDYNGTKVFDKFYTIQELIALLLRTVRIKTEAQLGEKVGDINLGRPVRFAADPEDDAIAQNRLHEAAQMAGFGNITFVPEPIAAASFYTHTVTREERVLVFDFGGGTLDLSVIHVVPGKPYTVLGTFGVLVGGDDFDSTIMTGKIARQLGKDATQGPDKRPISAHLYGPLERWQTMPLLSRMNNISLIRKAQRSSTAPEQFKQLEKLVMNNYGFALFREIEAAKRRLSSEDETAIELAIDDFRLECPITRREFQVLISSYTVEVHKGLDAVMEQAGISAESIDAVVTTGGSSLIPVYQRILSNRFKNANLVQSDIFGSVSAGLALY